MLGVKPFKYLRGLGEGRRFGSGKSWSHHGCDDGTVLDRPERRGHGAPPVGLVTKRQRFDFFGRHAEDNVARCKINPEWSAEAGRPTVGLMDGPPGAGACPEANR